ncbi:cornifelin-like isoform 1-T2 [Synchiropus picturatus]
MADWSSGLDDCHKDCKSCWLMICCPCCSACWFTKKYGKNPGILLFDLCSLGFLNYLALPLCVAPASLALRIDMRQKYGLEGSIFKDLATTCLCLCCSWCQMAREVEHQKNNKPPVVTMQPSSNPDPYQDQTGIIMATY